MNGFCFLTQRCDTMVSQSEQCLSSCRVIYNATGWEENTSESKLLCCAPVVYMHTRCKATASQPAGLPNSSVGQTSDAKNILDLHFTSGWNSEQ